MSSDAEDTELVQGYIESSNSDLLMFSGPIEASAADKFIRLVNSRDSKRNTASVFLTT